MLNLKTEKLSVYRVCPENFKTSKEKMHVKSVVSTKKVKVRIRVPVSIVKQEEPVQQDQPRVHRVALVRSLLLLLKNAVIVLKASTVVVQMQKLLVSIVLLAILVQPKKVDPVYPAFRVNFKKQQEKKFAKNVWKIRRVKMPIPLLVLIAKQEEPVQKDQLRVHRAVQVQS